MKKEFLLLELIALVCSGFGFPMILIVAIVWGLDETRRNQQYLLFIFISISSIFSLWLLVMSIGNVLNEFDDGHHYNNNLCHDNATELNQNDGISICVISAGIIMYCCLLLSICWCLQARDLFMKIVVKRKSKKYVLYHLFLIFILPLIPVLYSAINGSFGYDRVLPFCFISYKNINLLNSSLNYEFQIFYLLVFIFTFFGSICMIAVIVKIASGSFLKHSHLRNTQVAPESFNGTKKIFLSNILHILNIFFVFFTFIPEIIFYFDYL